MEKINEENYAAISQWVKSSTTQQHLNICAETSENLFIIRAHAPEFHTKILHEISEKKKYIIRITE